MLPQQYCLRWRYHHSNLQTMFTQLLERQAFCDVTLACDGKIIKAHKIVLSACSTYFETILSQYEEKDPILIMKDIKYIDIKCLVEFMYKGEINVDHCHLATLLKTAEELKIKGLAEVSWRDDDNNNNNNNNSNNGNNQNGDNCLQSSALQQVSTVMENPKSDTPINNNNNNHYHSNNNNSSSGNNNNNNNKRKRGRPPIDDYEQTFTTPKIMNVTGNADETYSNDAMSTSDHDLSIWEEDHQLSANEYGGSGSGCVGGVGGGDITETDEPLIRIKKETNIHDDDGLLDDTVGQYSPTDSKHDSTSRAGSTKSLTTTTNVTTSGTQSFLTPALEKEWPDVIKMNDYLNTGRRQQFWEEPFTKRVMDAIKTKNLEMKVAAELLGVSYGTLYGRYRDSYGCLKHPYRVRDFWSEQGPTDVLLKLKKKEITLYRAAEQLNVTPQTLSNYLISMSQIENNDTNFNNNNNSNNNNQSMECYNNNNNNGNDDDEEEDEEDDEHVDTDDDDDDDDDKTTLSSNKTSLFKKFLSNQTTSNTVLANCPDITIIKKEKHDSKINNNSDHSDNNSDHTK